MRIRVWHRKWISRACWAPGAHQAGQRAHVTCLPASQKALEALSKTLFTRNKGVVLAFIVQILRGGLYPDSCVLAPTEMPHGRTEPTSQFLPPPALLDKLCIFEEKCHRKGMRIWRITGLSPDLLGWALRMSVEQEAWLLSLFNKNPLQAWSHEG